MLCLNSRNISFILHKTELAEKTSSIVGRSERRVRPFLLLHGSACKVGAGSRFWPGHAGAAIRPWRCQEDGDLSDCEKKNGEGTPLNVNRELLGAGLYLRLDKSKSGSVWSGWSQYDDINANWIN